MKFRHFLFLVAIVGVFVGLGIVTQQSPSVANGGPTVSSLTPTSGPKTGGTLITISGSGLTGITGVTVDGQAATNVTVISDTSATFRTPAGTVGARDVVVNAGSLVTVPEGFVYEAVIPNAPTGVTGTARDQRVDLSWSAPGDDGGSAISGYRIESSTDGGANFAVNIDNTGSTATTASVSSLLNATTYVFRVAAINSVNAGDYSSNSSALTPRNPPQVTAVSPGSGTDLGGTTITISGTDFLGALTVNVGGTPVASYRVDSPTQITAVTDAGAAGLSSVVVTTPSGTSTMNNAFQYLAIPTITNINPFFGPLAGGTSVIITGTNFTGATSVTFGSDAATSYVVDSANQITAVNPAGSARAVDVQVITTDGAATDSDGFTYFAASAISALSVESGPTTGNTTVIITGLNFTGVTAVTFGAVNASSYTVNSATQITAVTPTAAGGAAGAVDVKVTNPGGIGTREDGFTYIAAGGPIEIVLRDKGETQIQFHICHNLPNPTNLNLGMQIEFRIRSGSSVVAPTNANWLQSTSPDVAYEPNNDFDEVHVPPADLGVSSSNLVMRYRPPQNPNVTAISIPACGQNMAGFFPWFSNQTGSVGGTWEDESGNPLPNGPALTPGSTYIIEATLLTTTRSGTITHTTYRNALVTTMGGGCPLGAPAESLPAFPQMWAGLDSDNRVVAVADVYAQNPWAPYPSVVTVAYTYPTWPDKTFARVGYYFDPRINDFGPEAVLGDVIRGSVVVSQADMAACEAAGYTISMTVDPASNSVCSISNGSVVGSNEGACRVNVTATGSEPASFRGLMPRAVASLTRSATFVVRESSSGGGGSGGGGSSVGSSGGSSAGSSGASSGGGGGGLSEIVTISPAVTGAPGSLIALAGWGLETTRAVFFGDYEAPKFSVVSGGHVSVEVPNIPEGVYPIHAVLAPEVGRATYWAGLSVQRSSAVTETLASEPGASSAANSLSVHPITNPKSARKVGRGVNVVDRATASAIEPTSVKRSVTATIMGSPKPRARVGVPIQLTVRGLPEDLRVRGQIRIDKKYRNLGFAPTSTDGVLTLPALEFTEPGLYRLRVTAAGKRYFLTLIVRR